MAIFSETKVSIA